MTALIYIGTQRGQDRSDDWDCYNIFDPFHPAHGATFSVQAGAHIEAVAAKAIETARRFTEKSCAAAADG